MRKLFCFKFAGKPILILTSSCIPLLSKLILFLSLFLLTNIRNDGYSETFCDFNLLLHKHKSYYEYWMTSEFINTYNCIKKTGTYSKISQRKVPMYLFGSTIGRTKFPQYCDSDGYHNLARPYANYKPNSKGRKIIDSVWFSEFVIYFLKELHPNKKKAKMTLFWISLAKKVIPRECRISDTFFNHMTLLGNLKDNEGSIHPHVDSEDVITALFHVGSPSVGGNTLYYDGTSKNSKGNIVHSIYFEHGRLQIGFYDKIVHSAEPWEGVRGGINLNLKRNVLSFFQKEKCRKYYNQYASAGWPSSAYVAV